MSRTKNVEVVARGNMPGEVLIKNLIGLLRSLESSKRLEKDDIIKSLLMSKEKKELEERN